ncbi:MAG: hypothetical protein A3G44_15660 [Candidatus Rokubacteria bacterium RIFCSPLOWO2_12_FULL_73_47]|nr:MAG: hypothetical protein A3G44_15660 [Candidatus Rokubacteria bacterium RIFCSPLOWO2_12_FULL_73_47]
MFGVDARSTEIADFAGTEIAAPEEKSRPGATSATPTTPDSAVVRCGSWLVAVVPRRRWCGACRRRETFLDEMVKKGSGEDER